MLFPVCTGDCPTTLYLEFDKPLNQFKAALKSQFISALREAMPKAGIPCVAVLSIDLVPTKDAKFFARITFVAHSHYLRLLAAIKINLLVFSVYGVDYVPVDGFSSTFALIL